MNLDQIRRAQGTLEDVFRPDGTAVTLGGRLTTRKGVQGVKGSGYDTAKGAYFTEWYPIGDLTAKEDI